MTETYLTKANKTPIAPSAVFSKYSQTTPKEMSIEDIKTVQKAFVNAAERAKSAGFEGIEIIGSAGYLITQFLSPIKNLRKDEYGGNFENRVRFQGCMDELFSGRPVSCIGNARAGFEGERNIVKCAQSKKIMVVGAGVGGLEAAVTAKRV